MVRAMAEKVPETMLMWTIGEEQRVVAVTTTPDRIEVGARLWCPKLDRWGKVSRVAPACTFVELEQNWQQKGT